MPYQLSKKIRELTPYEPISGDYKIRLDANESYILPSEEMLEKIKKAVSEVAFNRYPDPYCEELTEKFASYYCCKKENVTVGNGSDELISVITGSLLESQGKILVLSPDFSMYKFYGDIYQMETKSFAKDKDLRIDAEEVANYLAKNKTDMVIFSNPCNPTSIGLAKGEVEKIITASDALIVLDEAYMDFWSESLISKVGEYSNLIILKTASKAIGLAGIRLGFAVANEKLSTALKSAKSPYNVNAITQKIGEIIYSNPHELKEKTEDIIAGTKMLYQQLKELESSQKIERVYSSNTNFVFLKTKYAEDIFQALKEKSIVVRNFGTHLRITCGTKEENATLLQNLKKIL